MRLWRIGAEVLSELEKVDLGGWVDSLFMLFELLISSCLGRNVLICIVDGRAGFILGIGLLLTASHSFR